MVILFKSWEHFYLDWFITSPNIYVPTTQHYIGMLIFQCIAYIKHGDFNIISLKLQKENCLLICYNVSLNLAKWAMSIQWLRLIKSTLTLLQVADECEVDLTIIK